MRDFITESKENRATEPQIALLVNNGVNEEAARKMSKSQAKTHLDAIFQRNWRNRGSPKKK